MPHSGLKLSSNRGCRGRRSKKTTLKESQMSYKPATALEKTVVEV